MDSAKSAIKSLVLDLRKTLKREIEVQLRRYGISAGKWRGFTNVWLLRTFLPIVVR